MLFNKPKDYISLKEVDILLEELRMYKILIEYARGLNDRGLRIFKSMIKRVYLLDIENQDILLDVLNSIIYDIKNWQLFYKTTDMIDIKIADLSTIKWEKEI